MTPALQTAIAAVYSAFSDAERPHAVDACACCLTDAEASTLISKPLPALTPADLFSYTRTVFATAGSPEDFFYFLPRILEILATEPHLASCPEIALRALFDSGFHDWPDNRKTAILNCFNEVLGELLTTEGSVFDLDSWLCAFGRLQLDLEPYLSRIAASPEKFEEFHEFNQDELDRYRLVNEFWEDAPASHDVVLRWMLDTAQRMEMTGDTTPPVD